MRKPRIIVGVVAGLLALAGGDAAAERIVLKGGTVLDGTVTEVTAKGFGFRFIKGERAVTSRFTRAQVDPRTWYRVRARSIGDDAAAHLELARFCAANGLFALAERQLGRIQTADDALRQTVAAERRRVRAGAADALLALAEEALAAKQVAEAQRFTSLVLTRYRETPAVERAKALLEQIDDLRGELGVSRKVTERSEAERKLEARWRKVLASPRRRTDAAVQSNRRGLRAATLSPAIKAFAAAAAQARRAVAELEALERRHANAPGLAARIRTHLTGARALAVETHLNLGSAFLVRGSHTQALLAANNALAIDPGNRYVLEFRARVELAAAESAGRVYRRR